MASVYTAGLRDDFFLSLVYHSTISKGQVCSSSLHSLHEPSRSNPLVQHKLPIMTLEIFFKISLIEKIDQV